MGFGGLLTANLANLANWECWWALLGRGTTEDTEYTEGERGGAKTLKNCPDALRGAGSAKPGGLLGRLTGGVVLTIL